MKILLIYNPEAGHGRGRELLPQIEERLRSHGCELDLRLTEHSGHGISLTAEADLSRYDAVVAAGGDGTVYQVVTGYYRNPGQNKPPIGIIPAGTGNAFVREMDLKGSDWEKAVDTIVRGETRSVDVARFTTQGESHHTLNILGVGFVSDVSETSEHLKFLGANAYLLAVFYRLLGLRTYRLRLTFDGHSECVDACFAVVSNSRYTGTDFFIAPKASLDDGLLDLVVLKKISRWRVIQLFRTIFSGTHIREPEVEYHQARKITIDTETPRVLNVDGEVLGRTPVEIECLPGDLRLLW
ncbi:MAG: diacylglycerol kinase family lipid kinase [Longimicrobiales bacterium]|nr:diacylglycerol kinase family lipid kinase [Longimicrobiales bacterium]